MGRFIAILFGAPWLGHGRRLEAALTLICGIYGLGLFIFPPLALDSKATVDLYWAGYGRIIAVPFLLKAILTGWGLLANINAWSYSRSLRCCGALVGAFIWWAMIWKFTKYGAPFSFGSVCAVVFLLSSIGIFSMALANRPIPGAPGAL